MRPVVRLFTTVARSKQYLLAIVAMTELDQVTDVTGVRGIYPCRIVTCQLRERKEYHTHPNPLLGYVALSRESMSLDAS